MIHADAFRQDLSRLLRGRAADRQRSLRGGVARGEDLKIIALFERLAIEAESLPAEVIAAFEAAAGCEPLARCMLDHRLDLLAEVGVLVWPKDAADLVRWMAIDLAAARPGAAAPARTPPPPDPPQGITRDGSPAVRLSGPRARSATTTFWRDLCAGLAIVAPILALWHANLAIEQRRDQAILETHAAVAATVVSDAPAGDGRSASSRTNLVITFKPAPDAASCQVMMRSSVVGALAPGQSVMVVPRSPACEAPLMPAQVGDSNRTFGFAFALLIGGLLSLKVCGWLRGPATRRAIRPVWS